MTAVAWLLASALVVALGLVAWLAVVSRRDTQALAGARAQHGVTLLELERCRFELKTTQRALERAESDRNAFEESCAESIPVLPAGDVPGRLLQAAEATRADRDVPPRPDAAVPPRPAAERSDAAGLPVLLDPNEPLL